MGFTQKKLGQPKKAGCLKLPRVVFGYIAYKIAPRFEALVLMKPYLQITFDIDYKKLNTLIDS